jgi:hypothetical protein
MIIWNTTSTHKRFSTLIEKGLLTPEQLAGALEEQDRTGLKLGQILRDKALISEDDLVDVIHTRLGIPKLALDNLVIDPTIVEIVPLSLAKKHQLIPVFKIGGTLTVAMADPLDVIALDELKYLTNLKINRVVSTSAAVSHAINQYYSLRESMAVLIRYRGRGANRAARFGGQRCEARGPLRGAANQTCQLVDHAGIETMPGRRYGG